jgi:DNA polymerase-3 subunit alpha
MQVPLHNHSDYSNLDGNALPVEIAARAKELGCPSCAITDHGVVTGHLDFAKEMKAVGIKPIFGIEAYHGTKWTGFKGNERDQHHLILLAQNDKGLRNLWSLVDDSARLERYRFVPRVSWEALEKYSEGIIATSACSLGLVVKSLLKDDYEPLNRYLEIFGDNFYIELHTYDAYKHFEDAEGTQADINKMLWSVAQERGIPVVYANDAHYAFPEQYEFHDTYLVQATGKTKKGEADQTVYTPIEDRKMWHPHCLYIMGEDEIRERLNYLPDTAVDEAIANSIKIGEECSADLPEVSRHLPLFVPSECKWPEAQGFDSATELFIDLVEKGVQERYGEDAGPEVWGRAIREMEVFIDSGLEHYFLLDWDKCRFCDNEGILRGPGRGSAAGCLVAYVLGITDVDPLHYGLVFERFWNPGRAKGFPDIDTDFARKDRPRVVKYLQERWGEDKVRPIGNTGRMKPKSVIDKFYKACDISWDDKEELKKIVDTVPNINILGPDSIAWSREADPDLKHRGKERTIYVEDHVGDKIAKWIGRDDKRARFVRTCAYLTNRVSTYGIHASGVVVSDVPLRDQLPADLRGPKEERRAVTSFTMEDVDARMFVKSDVLGLKTLDTLDEWVKICDLEGFEWSGLDKLDYPEEMWQLLDKGMTAGIFQIESGQARDFCERFKVRSVEDLSIAGTIIRPGPKESMESFLIRRAGGEDDEFDGRKIPLLADVLEPTYGWFLYQEQVIEYFKRLGYNLSDADAVRKILGKKKPEELANLHEGREEWEGKSYRDIAWPQLGRETAEEVWAKLEDFARYSFNKAHAICYAVIGFRALMAKYYAPAEFYAACIATVEQQKKAEYIPAYISEARRLNIKTFPPDIMHSKEGVNVSEGNIYLGFEDVKGVASGGDLIVELRDQGIDISTPEKLFEVVEADAKALTKEKARYKKEGLLWDGRDKSYKQRLNAAKIQALYDAGAWDSLGERDVSMEVKQHFEKELLNVILTDDSYEVLSAHADEFDELDEYHEVIEATYQGEKLRFRVPGVVVNIKRVKSRANGQSMGIVTAEYGGETLEFATSPKTWKSHRFLWKDRTCAILELAKTERGLVFENGEKLT